VKRYYMLEQKDKEADVYIFGTITSWEWDESDVSSYTLAKEVQSLKDVDTINVHINSYGGEVGEGLAIYNVLRNHSAKVRTYNDGFACSIASVIFMAGDERIMSNASLLMVHNPWMITGGNAEELRKAADDLDIVAIPAINAYMDSVNITQEELETLLQGETWITPNDALEWGFATKIEGKADTPAAMAMQSVIDKMAILQNDKMQKPDDKMQKQIDEIKQMIEGLKPEEPESPIENKPLKMMAALFR